MNGLIARRTGMECKYGPMELAMRAIGKITKPMDKGSFGMWMAIPIKVNGKMTKPMGMECMFMRTEPSTKESGEMIFRMGME